MEHRLHENIRAQRKARGLTQEQLAEAMGVTVGAVSKWELGQSMPEIPLLMEVAHFFGMSVDALLGYQMQSRDLDAIIQRLKDFRQNKQVMEGVKQAEQAISRYPHHFEVTLYSARLYFLCGVETGDKEMLRRALTLHQHAIGLVSQNKDPDISELSLQNDIAEIYLFLDEDQKALEQLKKFNHCGINDALIGFIIASRHMKGEDAGKYLSRALLTHVVSLIRVVAGLVDDFASQGNFQEALDVSEWLERLLSGLRKPGKMSFLDKLMAAMMAGKAQLHLSMGRIDMARKCLMQAWKMAEAFDAAPEYQASSMRYYSGDAGTAYDDLGPTAMEGIERTVAEADNPALTALWQEVRHGKN